MKTQTTQDRTNQQRANKLRHAFYQLTIAWAHIHTTLPTPIHQEHARKTHTREYGHPAEWASDTTRKITNLLTEWHDLLAEHRNEKPPPTGCEQTRIIAAWRYLEPRIEQLIEIVDDEAFTEIHDLNREIRNRLGHTNHQQTLAIPCPNDDCQMLALQRRVTHKTDQITCGNCGYTTRSEHYQLLARIALDTLIDTAESTPTT